MSKAFVKDDADTGQEASFEPLDLATDGKYYITPAGMKRLQGDLEALKQVQAVPEAAANAKRRQQYLEKLVQMSEVIDPAQQSGEQARFGATVTVISESGERRTYRIVGIYEADAKQGRVSYLSPIAKALLGKCAGDEVLMQTPQGEEELEIEKVEYLPLT